MNLEQKISKLTKKELVDLIIELVEVDEDIEKRIEFKLISPDDEIKASKQLIRKYINENKRRGFISWKNVNAALQGAEMVLDKAREKLVNGEEEAAVRLGIVVLSISIDMYQYADDSSGQIGYVVNESITLLKDASSMVLLSTNYRVQDNMFQLILKEAMHKRYDGWNNVRHDLLDVCTIYSARSSARKKLEDTLEKMLTQVSTISSMSSDYDQLLIKQHQLKIFEKNGEDDKAEHLIKDNIAYREFREMGIEKEIANGNYETALQLCIDGETNDSDYPGLVKTWKQYRLQIYEAQSDIEKQKEVLIEFIYDNQYEAYSKLKDLYEENEWLTVLEDIFHVFEEKSGYLPHVYEYIAIAENRSDKILKYCQQSAISITELYPYLVKDYPDKVDEIFKKFIRLEAEHASDRKQYQHVCQKLKLYKDACGEEKFYELVKELKMNYHRKPAFINELDKATK